MHYAKSISLGILLGLTLVFAALAGLYVSPLRQPLYFAADPELAGLRAKLEAYREWSSLADSRIAMQAPAADSLRSEQESAWRDYKVWRTRLGELARAHAQASGPGFLGWAYSLRYWGGPAALAVMVFSASLAALGARNRYRPSRVRPGRSYPSPLPAAEPGVQARVEAEFAAAARQVADIVRQEGKHASGRPPPTDTIPIASYRTEGETAPGNPPEAAIPQFPPDAAPLSGGDAGRETRFLQLGREPDHAADSRFPAPGLSMEDEDSPVSGNDQATPGAMPPTTELERVERRKDEVLKMARKGLTSSEISRRLRISQDQVEFIIRLRREKG